MGKLGSLKISIIGLEYGNTYDRKDLVEEVLNSAMAEMVEVLKDKIDKSLGMAIDKKGLKSVLSEYGPGGWTWDWE